MIVPAIVAVLVGLGGLACVTGAIGLLRFPDVYTRLHAAGVIDTLGTGLVVLGLLVAVTFGADGWVPALIEGGDASVGLLRGFKLVSIVFFLWVSGTTAVHALAKAAWLDGATPWRPEDGERSTD